MATKEKELNFEESLLALEKIVKDLENGNIPLDDAITKFNEAMILAKSCNEKLDKANEQFNEGSEKINGMFQSEDLNEPNLAAEVNA